MDTTQDRKLTEVFKAFLSKNNHRMTPQRMAVLEASLAFCHPFTAEELIDRSKTIDSSVSRSTVYRTLHLILELGILRAIDIGREYKYYTKRANNAPFQAQIICDDCQKIFEIDAPFMEWYSNTATEKFNMQSVSQKLQVVARCRNDGRCSRKDTD